MAAKKNDELKTAKEIKGFWSFLAFINATDKANNKTLMYKILFGISFLINIGLLSKFTNVFSTLFKLLLTLFNGLLK